MTFVCIHAFVAAPSAFRLLGEIAALLAIYDVLFFAVHLTLHKSRTLYRSFHQKHHRHPVTRANDAVRLTLTEEVGWPAVG
eukprot:m.50648 g.50648  ORF g.50648 m.50648 type:complete len:81 (+) comp6556_c0_seq1:440-682(+)